MWSRQCSRVPPANCVVAAAVAMSSRERDYLTLRCLLLLLAVHNSACFAGIETTTEIPDVHEIGTADVDTIIREQNFEYVGCFSDPRPENYFGYVAGWWYSHALCNRICREQGRTYFVLRPPERPDWEFRGPECYCEDTAGTPSGRAADAECLWPERNSDRWGNKVSMGGCALCGSHEYSAVFLVKSHAAQEAAWTAFHAGTYTHPILLRLGGYSCGERPEKYPSHASRTQCSAVCETNFLACIEEHLGQTSDDRFPERVRTCATAEGTHWDTCRSRLPSWDCHLNCKETAAMAAKRVPPDAHASGALNNGLYKFAGYTADGRPWYARRNGRYPFLWAPSQSGHNSRAASRACECCDDYSQVTPESRSRAGGDLHDSDSAGVYAPRYLFFDKDCDGATTSTFQPGWVLSENMPDVNALSDLEGDERRSNHQLPPPTYRPTWDTNWIGKQFAARRSRVGCNFLAFLAVGAPGSPYAGGIEDLLGTRAHLVDCSHLQWGCSDECVREAAGARQSSQQLTWTNADPDPGSSIVVDTVEALIAAVAGNDVSYARVLVAPGTYVVGSLTDWRRHLIIDRSVSIEAEQGPGTVTIEPITNVDSNGNKLPTQKTVIVELSYAAETVRLIGLDLRCAHAPARIHPPPPPPPPYARTDQHVRTCSWAMLRRAHTVSTAPRPLCSQGGTAQSTLIIFVVYKRGTFKGQNRFVAAAVVPLKCSSEALSSYLTVRFATTLPENTQAVPRYQRRTIA